MPELRFDGEAAIVTGAGRGLGRAYALLLASRGALVVVNDLGAALDGTGGSDSPADSVVEEIERAGGRAVANHASVSDPDGAKSIVDDAFRAFGRIDILVNNAGIKRQQPFATEPVDDFRLLMEVSFFGALYMTKAVWPHMTHAGYGRVVNTVSSSIFGLPDYAAYVSSKGAVLGLTRALAAESLALGIRVNAVAPAAVTRFMHAGGAASSILDWAEKTLDPALVAPVVAFFAHKECPLNGVVFGAGGGQVGSWKLGETLGIVEHKLTPESIRDRLGEILDEKSFQAYGTTADQAKRMLPYLDAQLGR